MGQAERTWVGAGKKGRLDGGPEHAGEALSGWGLELAELIAKQVAARLLGQPPRSSRELIDANEVARILGCRRSWVYEHKAELPLVRLGGGSRPRLRFDREAVEAMVAGGHESAPEPAESRGPRRRAQRRYARRPAVELLEVKGRAP